MSHTRRHRFVSLLGAAAAALVAATMPSQNPIVVENQLPGSPPSAWYVPMPGDADIQGFATDFSVDRGTTVHFKIDTDATAYHIDVYRLGWYQGLGARLVGAGVVTATLPQLQPAPLFDPVTAMTDCGNWAESAHWDVPANAVSGVYLALLTRDDATPGQSTITFVVRDDASTAEILVQTSDATWNAYNLYGGASLYPAGGAAPGFNHATKASYNRPLDIRHSDGSPGDDLFAAEYALIRFLEANGYDVAYSSSVDTHRDGARLLQHALFCSVGHDEYWSGPQRANVTAARDAGVHLAFFSGNEVYWRVRYEPSIDASATPDRTMVCYKEGTLGENGCGGKCDPSPEWTGLWRDGCGPTYSVTDACSPENALTGHIGWDGTVGAIEVPASYKDLRFWRNTSIPALLPGQVATLGASTLGSEWDWEQYGDSYPPHRIKLSSTILNGHVHHLSLYRAASGALVFGAGTIQWSWGLDDFHTFAPAPVSADMQQATVNLFADMGIAPETLLPGLVPATASSDTAAPSSAITSPASGVDVASNDVLVVQGTAADTGGGAVAGVEVSTDGGVTWHAAQGTTTWSYSWHPEAEGPATIVCRAFDDTVNVELPGGPGSPNTIAVTVTPPVCPCTVFPDSLVPAGTLSNDGQAIELGMKFGCTVPGAVTALRYYKPAGASGAHVGNLWTSAGQLLASAPFAGETASGWQVAPLTSPVDLVPGATYVVSYFSPSGDYTSTPGFFAQQLGSAPLFGLADGADGLNGVYVYSPSPAFPTDGYQSSNYWADVVFSDAPPDTDPPMVVTISPSSGATIVPLSATVRATFDEVLAPASVDTNTFTLLDGGLLPVPATVGYDALGNAARLVPDAPLVAGTTYTVTLRGGAAAPHVTDLAGNPLAADVSWTFTTAQPAEGPFAALGSAPLPGTIYNDGQAIELGTRFRADADGLVTGLRYYKPAGATGVHEGHLWSNAGALLASATFTVETASGWQEVALATPVPVTAATTYVVSYLSPSGDYVSTPLLFATATGTGLVHGLADGQDGANGVYLYTPTPAFPTSSYNSSCYYADVVFYAAVPDVTAPTVALQAPAPDTLGVAIDTTVAATFDEPLDPATVDATSFTLRDGLGAPVAAQVFYEGVTNTARLVPDFDLAPGATYTATLHGGAATPHLTDLAGNALAGDVEWSFSTAALPSCPCSVFGPGDAPGTGLFNDQSPIEVGMRFRVDVDTVVTALRFYKEAGTAGGHEAHLWSDGGTLLATAPFAAETPSGWQEALLATPVPVTAGVTYVVSCFSSSGDYVGSNGYFTTTVGAGLVHGLADGLDGPNGVFAYAAAPVFPTGSFQSSNYFVDVVVHLPDQPRTEVYGQGCPGTLGRVPLLTAVGLPAAPVQPNPTFGLLLSNCRPLSIAVIAVGGDGVAGPACSLLIDDLTTTWARLTSASGTATVPLPIPPSPTLIGVALWLQAGVFDPAATTSALSGLALSQGLRITVGS